MIEADDDVEMIDISNVKSKSQIRAKLKNNDIYAKKQPTPEPSQPVAKGKNKSAEMLFLGIESDEEDEVGEGDEDPMSQELDDIAASKSPEPVPKNKNKSQDNQLDKKQKSKARPSSAPMQGPDLGQDPEHHPPAPKRAKHAEPIKKFASIFDSPPTQASSSACPSIFSHPIRRAKGELQVQHHWSLDPDEP